MDLGDGSAAGASSPSDLFPDYVLETEDQDSLNEPTFSSPPKLAFRNPGDSGSYPRNRSSDKLQLVLELDLASEFGSVEDESTDDTMNSRYLRQLPQSEREYKSVEYGTINGSVNDNVRVPINTDLPNNNTLSTERESSTDYHCHTPKPKKDIFARNQLIIVTILCAIFMVAEVIGGIVSNSLALVSDATHMASDFSSLLISLFAIWFSHKPATYRFTYGFHRAEVLGALVSVMIIWITTGVLVYLATHRVINKEYEINADEMLITAGLGVAFNIVMGVVLHGGFGLCKCKIPESGFGHSHSHSHSHGEEASNGHNHGHSHNVGGNINVRAAFIHVIGDTVQSIGVLIAAYIIKYKPEYKIADPICTFIFSVVVLFTTVLIFRDILTILMEGSPRNIKYPEIQKELQQIPGVKLAHSVQIMVLSVGKNTVTAHLAIEESTDWNSTLQTATKLLRQKYQVLHSTIQVELYQEDIMTSCDQCLGPNGRNLFCDNMSS